MPSFDTLVALATLAFVMALSPGPNLMLLASRSLCQGAAAGFATLAGVASAMLVYAALAAAGLSAVLVAMPGLLSALKMAGAGYLLWLALKVLRQRSAPRQGEAVACEPHAVLFRRGLLTCLLNPKIVLMYSALLPQFVSPEAGEPLAQMLALGMVQVVSAASAHACVILGAAGLTRRLRRSARWARAQRLLLAGLLAAVAVRTGWPARGGV